MTTPLALLIYENLLPGSQLVNRLQDLGYRVQTLATCRDLRGQAVKEKPLLILLDLESTDADPCAAIQDLRQTPETAHLPILAFSRDHNLALREAARLAGANLVASDAAILPQLAVLLNHLFQLD